MKTGAGEDPFADESEDDDGGGSTGSGGGRGREERPDGRPDSQRRRGEQGRSRVGSAGRDESGDDGASESGTVEPSDLPFIARRNARGDNVKAGRDTRRLFELRPAVAEREEPFMEALERELGTAVPKTDAREAALAVVYDRPELVAEKLEEWGVNYFEE